MRIAPVMAALLVPAAMALAEVKVSDTGYKDYMSGGKPLVRRLITVENGRKLFKFKSNGTAVGLALPVQMNWKMNELCTVWVNGERYFEFRGDQPRDGFVENSRLTVGGDATEARLEAVQEQAQAKVTLMLVVRDGDDKVLLTVRVEPKQPLQETRIGLECFPSTDEPKAKLTRAIATARRTQVLQPEQEPFRVKLDADDRWVFLHDAAYDLGAPSVGPRKAGGGCALFYNPAETKLAEVVLMHYHPDAYFTYGPEVKEMHLLVYDFAFEKTNHDVVEYLMALDAKGVSTDNPSGK